jgi:hypothetical protein
MLMSTSPFTDAIKPEPQRGSNWTIVSIDAFASVGGSGTAEGNQLACCQARHTDANQHFMVTLIHS